MQGLQTTIGKRPQPLTPKQREALDFVRAYIETHRYAPTAQELADHFRISRNAAVERLARLREKHHINLYERAARGIELIPPRKGSSN